MRQDHKGFTLVELLIAIAIFSIVTASVCGFIVVGSKSYSEGNNDITIQQEAQLALNQMSDVLIDTTRSVNYVGYNADGSVMDLVLKDAEFSSEPESKALIMYNGEVSKEVINPGLPSESVNEIVSEGNGNKNYQFLWSRTDETLYYSETDVSATPAPFPGIGEEGCVVLAEHVTDFSVDLSLVEEKRVVQLSLTFAMGRRTYTTSNNVTVRNKIAINDAEVNPLDKSKTLNLTLKKNTVVLEPGESYHFSTPKVTGTNVMDKSVVWCIDGAGTGDPPAGGSTPDGSSITDSANGILQISTTESASSFEVLVTTNAKDSDENHASRKVTVYIKRADDVSFAFDASSPTKRDELSPNAEFTLSAQVLGKKLGTKCDGTGCGWDIARDKEVQSWAVVSGPATMLGADGNNKMRFRVNPDAEKDDVIVIAAMASISSGRYNNTNDKRSYLASKYGYSPSGPGVIGYIEITVPEFANIVSLGAIFEYGSDNTNGNAVLLQVQHNEEAMGNLHTTGGGYIVCIRIRSELYGADTRFAIFTTVGNNIRFDPDFYGLDITKRHYVLMTLIDPVPKVNDKPGNYQPSSNEELTNELTNASNWNSMGGYIGSKYYHSDVYTWTLEPPNISVKSYSGNVYPGDGFESYSFFSGDMVFNGYSKESCENIDINAVNYDQMKYTFYRANGDSFEGATKIYGYNGDTFQYQTYADSPWFQCGTSITPGSNTIRRKSADNKEAACGKYYIVPGFTYHNQPQDRNITYLYPEGANNLTTSGADMNLRQRYPGGDFNDYYYELSDARIPLIVSKGYTMELQRNGMATVFLDFPLPSSGISLFRQGEVRELKNRSYALYNEWGTVVDTLVGVDAKCVYNTGAGIYELTLVSNKMNGMIRETQKLGKWTCSPSGDMWTTVELPDATVTKEVVSNTDKFIIAGTEYKAYIPSPKETTFTTKPWDPTPGLGFTLSVTGKQTSWGTPVIYICDLTDTTGETSRAISVINPECEYSVTDGYTVYLYSDNNKTLYGIYKWNGTKWIKQ